jgi:3-oxoacyl-[acyl-carrier-protein] synthase-1
MSTQALAIVATGLVTSVGLSAPATCAAIRAGVTNPSETRFIDSAGEWIMGHSVPLKKPWRGRTKLAKMAAMAIDECLNDITREECTRIPLLLCVAERERPGRLEGLDDQLFLDIQQELDVHFAPESAIVPQGRVSIGIALMQARKLIYERNAPRVLIAATDGLLSWPTLSVYERNDRLLTGRNSNGFMPGEAGGALLLSQPSGAPELICTGIGFGMEHAHIDSEEPLRAEGLTRAIKAALLDAGCQMHDLDFRITDISGEQYYFKEAALALGRILRQRKEEFDIWHPAECIGESGAVAGLTILTVANAACRKAYAAGPNILAYMANDAGQRAAAVLRFRGA